MESNHHSLRRRGYSALSSPCAQRPHEVARVGLEPTSRAHEAREEATPPPRDEQVWPAGVEPAISGAQNRRGGHLPHSQMKSGGGLGFPQSGAETSPIWRVLPKPSVARRHACQPFVTAAGDPPLSDAGCTLRPTLRAAVVPSLPGAVRRRPVLSALAAPHEPGRGPGGVREVDDRGIEPRLTAVSERRLPNRPVVEVLHGASPGNRTLLHGFTTRGLATSLATQSRREESNPRTPR